MNSVRFTARCSAAAGSRLEKNADLRLGVQRIEDPHHPRGNRELRSPAEMRKLLNRKIVEQEGKCAICRESFTDYSEIVPDHISNPRAWDRRGEMTIPTM